jgi:SAM-dependent methyltransferase
MDAETFAAHLRETLGPAPWCIDHVEIAEGIFEMRGWALAPGGRQADLTFTVDDRDFAQVEYPLPRRDIEQVFWFHPGASAAAFRCRTPLDTIAFPDGHATLRCVRRATRLPIRSEYDCYYPAPGDEPPLPDETRRRRVAGNPSAEVFRLEGFSALTKLEQALNAVDTSLREAHGILDWGCGSGRVTRYLPRFSRGRITGVDIDADNLAWCRRHLSFGDFRRVPLRPPTDLPAGAFDVVIGISVCTHLREPEQRAWLGELARLTAPGGYVLLTVLGGPNVTWSRFDAGLFEQWRRTGFLAIGGNTDLKGHIDEDDYYVNTYMTEGHVRQSWGRFFDVRAIVPGLIGNNQDLVVLHKPKHGSTSR